MDEQVESFAAAADLGEQAAFAFEPVEDESAGVAFLDSALRVEDVVEVVAGEPVAEHDPPAVALPRVRDLFERRPCGRLGAGRGFAVGLDGPFAVGAHPPAQRLHPLGYGLASPACLDPAAAGAYALDAAAVAVVVGDVCAVYLATSSHTQDYTMFCNA